VHMVGTNCWERADFPQHSTTTEIAVTCGNVTSRQGPSPLRTPRMQLIIPRSRVRVPPAPLAGKSGAKILSPRFSIVPTLEFNVFDAMAMTLEVRYQVST